MSLSLSVFFVLAGPLAFTAPNQKTTKAVPSFSLPANWRQNKPNLASKQERRKPPSVETKTIYLHLLDFIHTEGKTRDKTDGPCIPNKGTPQ